MSRLKPRPGLELATLATWERTVALYPSRSAMFNLAAAFALNGEPGKALEWLQTLCKLTTVRECAVAERSWQAGRVENASLAAVKWPVRP